MEKLIGRKIISIVEMDEFEIRLELDDHSFFTIKTNGYETSRLEAYLTEEVVKKTIEDVRYI